MHVKTLRSQKLRMLLTHRQLLLSKAIALENDLRGTLRNFGLKVGMVGHRRHSGSLPQIQVRRGGVWSDMRQVSIGGGGLGRQNIALWR